MDFREKLIELIGEAIELYPSEREELADYLTANGVTMQEWISVNDRLPEEKVDCIVHYKHAYCDNDGYWAIGICFYDGEKFRLDPAYKVTHWMQMPLSPEVKND